VLLETLIQRLELEFSSLRYVANERKRTIVIPPRYEEFGNIEIQEDYGEFIVFVGNFTHWHVGYYGDELSEEEKTAAIVDDAIEFLHNLFDDKIVSWGSHREGGGFIYRKDLHSQEILCSDRQKWLWSRPLYAE
jgi:hypothetical protein